MEVTIVKYSIAKVNSEDDEFPASKLLSPGPSCPGWITDKYCMYPQVIINIYFDRWLKLV